MARIGQAREGWLFLEEHWNHDAWDEYYGSVFTNLQLEYGDKTDSD